jgi:hypothetical protein
MRLLQILKNKFMAKQQIENSQFYVWIKSERVGQVVEVDQTKSDPKWIIFTDGTQCNREVVDEFLLPANTEDQALMIAKDFGGILTKVEKTEIEDATPVRPRRDAEPTAEVNVMLELLKKMSAKNKADLPIKVNLPSKEVYNLLKDQMDITKRDLNSQIVALVENQIDNSRNQLKEQIETFITNYYNNGRTTNTTTGNESNSTESGNS